MLPRVLQGQNPQTSLEKTWQQTYWTLRTFWAAVQRPPKALPCPGLSVSFISQRERLPRVCGTCSPPLTSCVFNKEGAETPPEVGQPSHSQNSNPASPLETLGIPLTQGEFESRVHAGGAAGLTPGSAGPEKPQLPLSQVERSLHPSGQPCHTPMQAGLSCWVVDTLRAGSAASATHSVGFTLPPFLMPTCIRGLSHVPELMSVTLHHPAHCPAISCPQRVHLCRWTPDS